MKKSSVALDSELSPARAVESSDDEPIVSQKSDEEIAVGYQLPQDDPEPTITSQELSLQIIKDVIEEAIDFNAMK